VANQPKLDGRCSELEAFQLDGLSQLIAEVLTLEPKRPLRVMIMRLFPQLTKAAFQLARNQVE
jgi:hypothetical protein